MLCRQSQLFLAPWRLLLLSSVRLLASSRHHRSARYRHSPTRVEVVVIKTGPRLQSPAGCVWNASVAQEFCDVAQRYIRGQCQRLRRVITLGQVGAHDRVALRVGDLARSAYVSHADAPVDRERWRCPASRASFDRYFAVTPNFSAIGAAAFRPLRT